MSPLTRCGQVWIVWEAGLGDVIEMVGVVCGGVGGDLWHVGSSHVGVTPGGMRVVTVTILYARWQAG